MKRETQPSEFGLLGTPPLPAIRSGSAANGMEKRRTETRLPSDTLQILSENRKTEQI